MNVRIVCVGKLKESYWRDACSEYVKRLSRYGKTEIVEVAEEPLRCDISAVRAAEERRLLAKCAGYAVALDSRGKNLSSEDLARFLGDLAVDGHSTVTFFIGGSHGFSDKLTAGCDYKLSFGKNTYPHQLMRVLLLEQVYRAFCINEGTPYHK